MNSARITAVRLLMKTMEAESYSNLLLDQALEKAELPAQEKAFCTKLYYGVLERLLTLEHLLRTYSGKNPEKLDEAVKYILYLGFYQMQYCDTIPDRAAVNECVKMTGYFRKKSAASFVNAILRKFQRSGKKIPLTGDHWQDMQILYSAPMPLLQTVTAEQGEAFAKTFFENSLQSPPCCIRKNPLKMDTDDLQELHPVPCAAINHAYYINHDHLRYTSAFQKGLFHVQDLASQICCKILDPHPGETILDMCAAPGGKSFTIAEIMQNQGHVFAFDLHPHRVKLIQEGAERLGLTCIHTDVRNAAEYDQNTPEADRILCDVPCSGLGVIRRKPEIKYKSLNSFEELPVIQSQILETSANYLKPGGILVYSTCTILKRENENLVQKFLDMHPDFEPVPLEEFHISECWITLPVKNISSDGFFAAKIRRKAVKS